MDPMVSLFVVFLMTTDATIEYTVTSNNGQTLKVLLFNSRSWASVSLGPGTDQCNSNKRYLAAQSIESGSISEVRPLAQSTPLIWYITVVADDCRSCPNGFTYSVTFKDNKKDFSFEPCGLQHLALPDATRELRAAGRRRAQGRSGQIQGTSAYSPHHNPNRIRLQLQTSSASLASAPLALPSSGSHSLFSSLPPSFSSFGPSRQRLKITFP